MTTVKIAKPCGKTNWKDVFFGALVTLYGIFLLWLVAGNLARVYKARFW